MGATLCKNLSMMCRGAFSEHQAHRHFLDSTVPQATRLPFSQDRSNLGYRLRLPFVGHQR